MGFENTIELRQPIEREQEATEGEGGMRGWVEDEEEEAERKQQQRQQ